MKKSFLWVFVLLFLIIFIPRDSKIALAQQKKLDKVTLRMNWIPYVDYAFYVIGLKKGFYLEE